MTTRRKTWLILGVALVATAGITTGAIVSQSSTPPNLTAPSCAPDPAAAIAATSAGGVWQGSGCYDTAGIVISKPITIDGGTFDDSASAAPLKPIFKVLDTSHVTIENVTMNGANAAGGYHAKLVGQAGIDVRSASDVTLTNDATNNTYGDGLTLFFQPKDGPDSNITVDGYTVTNAGRQGITPADVTSGTFTNIHIVSAADAGIDFESDLKTVGDGALSFSNVTTAEGIHIVEPYTALTFTNTAAGGSFLLNHAGTVSYEGSFTCNRRSPVACVTVKAGTLTLNATFAYKPGTAKATELFTRAVAPGVIVVPSA